MNKQPEFRKYLPLDEWFRKRPDSEEQIELTLDEVEAILGDSFAQISDKVDDLVDKCPAQDPESSHGLAQ